MKTVAIIGGGIGGLASANLLAKAGYQVTVYEKNSQLGGRAGQVIEDGFTFDTGPSWYLMPEVFEHYFSLLDQSVDELLELEKLTPSYRVFYEDKSTVDITADLERDAQTFEALETGAGDALRTYTKRGQELYDLSIEHFLYTNFARRRDLVHPKLLKSAWRLMPYLYQSVHGNVARSFTHPKLQKILEYPTVFLGSSPYQAPALYSLMSALDFSQGVYYPKGGLYTIIERLINIGQQLGVDYRTNSPVRSIVVSGGRANAVQLDDVTIPVDIVISNADIVHTEQSLLDEPHRSFKPSYWSKRDPGMSAILVYLGVEGKLEQLTHHNLFFVDNWQENFDAIYKAGAAPHPASLYLCKPSATDPTVTPPGHENLFMLVPFPANFAIESEEADSLVDSYLSQAEAMSGISDLRSRIVTKRYFLPQDFGDSFNAWQFSALGQAHTLSQSAFFRTANKSQRVSNLYYVGASTLPGIGLPMCLISAELIYKHIANDHSPGPISAIERLI